MLCCSPGAGVSVSLMLPGDFISADCRIQVPIGTKFAKSSQNTFMRPTRILFLVTFLFSFHLSYSQSPVQLGLFAGTSNYQGDLVGGAFVGRFTRLAIGLTGSYDLSSRFSLRAGYTHAALEGSDKYNSKEYLRLRNLSFETKINEFSLVGVYHIFNADEVRLVPYVFGGLAWFHFNPFAQDSAGQTVYLKPLSTEGQGLAQYPARKLYALGQLAIPFGAGVRFAVSDRIAVGLEAGIRKTFTDYIDDVSTDYVDAADLLAARGRQAVDFAYRGDEVAGGDPAYPQKGYQRGGANRKDIYYFTGVHLAFRLGSGEGKTFAGRAGRRGLGCPRVGL
ncbi:MAG: outer rane beta-barrel protein [Flaviaesturariibacter sp.]|nr:outer rane beta-barrel protein [Flaviaesturariibacter sp.]